MKGLHHVGITVKDLDASMSSNNRGASHVAFAVDDIEAEKAELETEGD